MEQGWSRDHGPEGAAAGNRTPARPRGGSGTRLKSLPPYLLRCTSRLIKLSLRRKVSFASVGGLDLVLVGEGGLVLEAAERDGSGQDS